MAFVGFFADHSLSQVLFSTRNVLSGVECVCECVCVFDVVASIQRAEATRTSGVEVLGGELESGAYGDGDGEGGDRMAHREVSGNG